MGAVRPLDTGISPPCANAALSTAGLAWSLELHASTAGALALGRGGDSAGPELMQCRCQPGPADAAPLSTQDHGRRGKTRGDGHGREAQEVCPAPSLPCVRAGNLGTFSTPLLRSFLEN